MHELHYVAENPYAAGRPEGTAKRNARRPGREAATATSTTPARPAATRCMATRLAAELFSSMNGETVHVPTRVFLLHRIVFRKRNFFALNGARRFGANLEFNKVSIIQASALSTLKSDLHSVKKRKSEAKEKGKS